MATLRRVATHNPERRAGARPSASYNLIMKNALSDKARPTPKMHVKRRPTAGLLFIEMGVRASGPAPDAQKRLAAFYAKYPLRTLKRGERGIVEGLKADRDRR